MIKQAALTVENRAEAALCESPIHALRHLEVERQGETLTLKGRVDTYYHKQLAQELVRAIADDCRCEVVNAVDVEYEAEVGVLRPR